MKERVRQGCSKKYVSQLFKELRKTQPASKHVGNNSQHLYEVDPRCVGEIYLTNTPASRLKINIPTVAHVEWKCIALCLSAKTLWRCWYPSLIVARQQRFGPSSVFTFLSHAEPYNTTHWHLSSGDWEWKIFECINDEKGKKRPFSSSSSADDGLLFVVGRKKISIAANRVVVTAM